MYASNIFDKKEMTEWENKTITIRTISTKQSCTSKVLSKTTKSMHRTAAAQPASTTLKVQSRQPKPMPKTNCESTLSGLCRQQSSMKSKQPTSVTAQKHCPTQWPHRSRSCWTRLLNSPKQRPATKTCTTGAAAEAATAVAANYAAEDVENCTLWYNATNHKAWAATTLHMDSIQPAGTKQAPPVNEKGQAMTLWQRGMTGKAAASIGHHPSVSASSSRAT